MQQIAAAAQAGPTWREPRAMRREYELRAGERLVATLAFRSAWGTLATGESADGCWSFKRVGFWRPRVTVRRCGSPDDMATFEHDTWTGGGTLARADGRAYRITTNTWQTKLAVLDGQERPLLHYATEGWLRLGAALRVEPRALAQADLPWLALFGWYAVVMLHQDAATTAATTAAT